MLTDIVPMKLAFWCSVYWLSGEQIRNQKEKGEFFFFFPSSFSSLVVSSGALSWQSLTLSFLAREKCNLQSSSQSMAEKGRFRAKRQYIYNRHKCIQSKGNKLITGTNIFKVLRKKIPVNLKFYTQLIYHARVKAQQ